MTELSGLVAVVTGAASGFGRAISDDLAARGYRLIMLDRDAVRVAEAAADVRSTHRVDAIGRQVDVASLADLQEVASLVASRFGRCDLLWANVGVQRFGAVETISEDVWRWILDVNVIGAARTVDSFLPLLRQAPGSRIVFTASANALAPAARLGAYQVSKYAVVGLAASLRMELAGEGIGVSVVYPSGMITRHLESSAEAQPEGLGPGGVSEADLNAMMASRPMTEIDLASPEDAARVAVDGVLAGEPHVITHGSLRGAVREHHAELEAALGVLDDRMAGEAG